MSKTDIETALEHCAREPVHIPGKIQGHGAIIAVDNDSLCLTHASENLEKITGLSCQSVLGQSIYDVFPPGVRHDLVNIMLPSYLQQDTRLIDPVQLNGQTLVVGSAAAEQTTIFEFEPLPDSSSVLGDAIKQLAFTTAQLQNITDLQTLFSRSVMLLQVLTGYQRVMVYQFDAEGNGTVKAETVSGNMEPFLGLNFPAWDIPEQARAIMKRVPIRYIGDVNQPDVPVLAATDATPPLNMTLSHLRGVSPVHMEYLRNMGTEATLTISVVVQDQLWGMISLHHPSPRMPQQATREVCSNFGRFFSLKLEAMLQGKRLERLREADRLRAEITDTAEAGETDIRFDIQLLERLKDAMNADGALLVKDGMVKRCGLAPENGAGDALLKRVNPRGEALITSAVVKDFPDLAAVFGPEFGGVFATPIKNGNIVAFFRRARDQDVTWAGSLDKTIVGKGADARLRPRGSFAAYKETVHGTSSEWTPEQRHLAREIWSIFVKTEHKALIEKTARQQKMLIGELNHRVRNILALIRSLSRQSFRTAENLEGYVTALEARIEAVANAHTLAVEQPDQHVSVRSVVQLEAAAHDTDGQRIQVHGQDAGLPPEVTPVFALIVHELMTNAAKYGALSVPEGQIDVSLEQRTHGLMIRWKERGGPPVTTPKHEGFGSVLLGNAVSGDLRGTVTRRFDPDGVEVVLELPFAMSSLSEPVLAQQVVAAASDGAEQAGAKTEGAIRSEVSCLLVEDSFIVSMDTVQVLRDAGFQNVQTAMSSRDAVQSIGRTLPDFAVLDVNLSGGDTSLGVADSLREQGVPFLFVTGYGSDGVPAEVFPDAIVLRKPLQRQALEAALTGLGI